MVVGVCDASDPTATDPHNARAWGLHLTHGALYTKKQMSSKGVLSTKQLVSTESRVDESPAADAAEIEIEIEVDMQRRKIAFGKPGGRLIEAPVTLSSSVRPWAYLWNAGDAVMIDARPQGMRASRMGQSVKLGPKPITAPLPLRAQAQWIIDPITGEEIYFGGASRGGGGGGGYGSPRGHGPPSSNAAFANLYAAERVENGDYLPGYVHHALDSDFYSSDRLVVRTAVRPSAPSGRAGGSGRLGSASSPAAARSRTPPRSWRPARSDWHAAAAEASSSPQKGASKGGASDGGGAGSGSGGEGGIEGGDEAVPAKGALQSEMQEEGSLVEDPKREEGADGTVGMHSPSRGSADRYGRSPGRSPPGTGRSSAHYALSSRATPMSPRTSRGRSITHMYAAHSVSEPTPLPDPARGLLASAIVDVNLTWLRPPNMAGLPDC